MKIFVFLAALFAPAFSFQAAPPTLEDISPHFSTNAQILWQAPTNHMPKSFWTYKILPRIFPAPVISNAIILASLQSKGFPKPSADEFHVWEDKGRNYPGPLFSIFSIITNSVMFRVMGQQNCFDDSFSANQAPDYSTAFTIHDQPVFTP